MLCLLRRQSKCILQLNDVLRVKLNHFLDITSKERDANIHPQALTAQRLLEPPLHASDILLEDIHPHTQLASCTCPEYELNKDFFGLFIDSRCHNSILQYQNSSNRVSKPIICIYAPSLAYIAFKEANLKSGCTCSEKEASVVFGSDFKNVLFEILHLFGKFDLA